MEDLRAEVHFWETVHHLIQNEKLSIVHLNEEGCIVWLEDDRDKNSSLIRLQLKSYDWAKQLRTDIKRAYESAAVIRKRLKLQQANITNVVFTPLSPVDSYEDDVNQALPFTAGGRKQMRTIVIPMSELQEKFFPLATEWKLQEMPAYIPAHHVEDAEEQQQLIKALKHSIRRIYQDKQERERSVFMYGKPKLTTALLIIIFLIFFYMESIGSSTSTTTLVQMGAKFDPLILEGEWWRFFSAMFLHIGFLHLFMNSLALFYLGGAVERIFGSGRFLLIYFIAGFAGSIASFVFNDNISAGASGAIFGLFGALLYFGIRNRRIFFRTFGSSVIVILIINLGFGFAVPMIDNGAHIGGLVGGFAAAAFTGLPKRKFLKSQPFAAAAGIIGAVVLLTAGYSQSTESTQLQAIYYELGRESVEQNNLEDAEEYLEQAIATPGDGTGPMSDDVIEANAYFLLSYTQLNREEYEEAEANLKEALALRPDFHEAHYNLAILYYELGDWEDALESIDRAVELEENSEYEELRTEILNNTPNSG